MKQNETTQSFDVIIIGGGATGAGTARDCSRRGVKTLLLERFDISTGATGRNHGLLHSGARYAVTDKESAEECIKENMILRQIASHCVEETDGLFLSLPEDDLSYQSQFVEACHQLEKVNYYLDLLLNGELQDRIGFLVENGKDVEKIEKRMEKYRRKYDGETERSIRSERGNI